MVAVDRGKVLAYRMIRSQLHERVDRHPGELEVLDLGVPNVPAGSARQALAVRTSRFAEPLALVWATRGAPHLHRPEDVEQLATALWPVSDADAAARFGTNLVPEGVAQGLAAFRATAEAFQAAVREAAPKGDVSRAVSDRVPAELTYDCASCAARHISGSIFQQAGLAGGVQLDEAEKKTVLMPLRPRPAVPEGPGRPEALILACLRLLGPATETDVAKYFGTTAKALRPAWPRSPKGPGELVEVTVEGRKAWLPEASLADLEAAEPVRGVRLLPPSDPFLQARDRWLLAPDKAKEKAIWRPLGNPGVLLVDGDVAGTWRAKVTAKKLSVTVTPWAAVARGVWGAVEEQAGYIAEGRGIPAAVVTVERGDT